MNRLLAALRKTKADEGTPIERVMASIRRYPGSTREQIQAHTGLYEMQVYFALGVLFNDGKLRVTNDFKNTLK